MTTYYVDNTKPAGEPAGARATLTDAIVTTPDLSHIDAASGTPFSVCAVGDPIWIASTGVGGNAIIGIYIIEGIVGGGTGVEIDRNAAAAGGETGVTVWYQPCDGTAQTKSGGSPPYGADGPFPTLQYATDNADDDSTIYVKANSGYKFDNLDQPEQASAYWMIDGFSGDLSDNTFAEIMSYGTTPGDGVETTLDANGGTVHVVWITGFLDNVRLKGFHATNTTGTGGRGIYVTSVCKNIILENCRASETHHGISTNTSGDVHCINCTGFNNRNAGIIMANTSNLGFMHSCEAYGNSSAGLQVVYGPVAIVNCLAHSGNGNDDIMVTADGKAVVVNCTSDGSDRHGIMANDADSTVLAINTTVSNSTGSNFRQYSTGKGSVYATYCNSYNGGSADVWNTGDGIQTVDPRLSGNHEILNSSLKEQGYPDHLGNNSVIGADAAVRRDQPKPASVAGAPEGAF